MQTGQQDNLKKTPERRSARISPALNGSLNYYLSKPARLIMNNSAFLLEQQCGAVGSSSLTGASAEAVLFKAEADSVILTLLLTVNVNISKGARKRTKRPSIRQLMTLIGI